MHCYACLVAHAVYLLVVLLSSWRKPRGTPTGLCEKTLLWKRLHREIGFQSTRSEAREQFLPLDYRARACRKGTFFFTDTGMAAHRQLFDPRGRLSGTCTADTEYEMSTRVRPPRLRMAMPVS